MKTTAALAAKAIKTELKRLYPNVKFSVSSDTYSMGDKVTVSYTDGPLYDDIDKIVSKYQYGSFNGMIDLYEYDNKNETIPQAKFVSVNRHISEPIRQTIIEKLKKMYDDFSESGWVKNGDCWGQTLIYREFVKMSL